MNGVFAYWQAISQNIGLDNQKIHVEFDFPRPAYVKTVSSHWLLRSDRKTKMIISLELCFLYFWAGLWNLQCPSLPQEKKETFIK